MSTLLAQPFRLEAVQGLTRWSEVRAYAEARARDAVGLSGERAGRCVVAVGDWSDKWPSTAVAMSLEVRDALYAAASAHRCAIDAIRPWWAQAAAELAAESSESALIALSDNDGLVLLADREERFTATCYAPLPEPAECDRLLSRVAITGGDGVAMRRYRLDPQSRSGKRGCFAWVEDAPQ
jgi:hypothetical protein